MSTDPLLSEQQRSENQNDADYVIAFKFFDKIFHESDRLSEMQIKDMEEDVFRIDLEKQIWNEDQKPAEVRALWNKQKIYENFQWHIENILEKKCQFKITKKKTDEHLMFLLNIDEVTLMVEASRFNYRIRCREGYDEGLSSKYGCQPFAKFQKEKFLDKNDQLIKSLAETPENERIFETHENSYFRQIDRVRLIYSRLNQYLNLSQATQWNLCRGFVPQQTMALQEINQNWLSCNPCKRIPLQQVRDYFGEQVALYFKWTETLVFWLLFPSAIGILSAIISYYFGGLEQLNKHTNKDLVDAKDEPEGVKEATSSLSNQQIIELVNLTYSIVIIVWAVVFLEFWKRKQKHQALDWGCDNFEEEQEPRAEFDGERLINPINDKRERMFPSGTRTKRQLVGVTVAILFIAVTLIAIAAIFLYKASVQISEASIEEKKRAGVMAGLLNSCQIKIMNFLYQKCAVWLTDWENYRTQTEYNDALYGKIFAFQFINSFTSLYYIAFIKSTQEGCNNGNCTAEISMQLLILFLMFIGFNGLEIGIPMIKKIRADRTQVLKDKYESEVDMQCPEVEGDYLELMVCFGYLTLFTASLPISPVLAYIAIAIEIRVDAYKFGKLTQRPFPIGAADIGIWESILHFLVYAAVVTNIGLIIITDNKFDLTDGGKWGWFIIIEHAVLFIIWLVQTLIPDEDQVTDDLKKRHEHVINTKYFGIVDED